MEVGGTLLGGDIVCSIWRHIAGYNSGMRLAISCEHIGTTAREKTVFMYSKLIECAVNAVLRPQEYFVWGLSYEVPLRYGLINKSTLMDQRYSTTMNEDSFARKLLREHMVTYARKAS